MVKYYIINEKGRKQTTKRALDIHLGGIRVVRAIIDEYNNTWYKETISNRLVGCVIVDKRGE